MKSFNLDNKILSILRKNKIKKSSIHEPFFSNIEIKNIKRIIKKNSLGSFGNDQDNFRNKLRNYTNSKYAVVLNSGTSALHLALKTIGVNKNDEILMPSLNYIASANTTLYCGGIPHFVEISDKTLGVDPKKLEIYLKKITKIKKNVLINKKTKRKIKALICLHTFGHSSEILSLKKICKKFKIFLIEDAAEALGSFYKKRHLGTFGEIGILSFNVNKIVTTIGGGAVLTPSKKIANKIFRLSNISKKPHAYKFIYDDLGYNYKTTNLNCAIGLAQMTKINKFLKKKRKLYLKYKKMFSNIDSIEIFSEPKYSRSNYWLQTLILKKPSMRLLNNILNTLNKNGYGARPVWQLLHNVSYLKKYPKTNLKVTENFAKRIINLPSSSFL